MKNIEKAILVIIIIMCIALVGYGYYENQTNKEMLSTITSLEDTLAKLDEPISTNINLLNSLNSEAGQLADNVASTASSLSESLDSYRNITEEINNSSNLISSNTVDVTNNLTSLKSKIETQINNVSDVASLTGEMQASVSALDSQVNSVSSNLEKLEKQSATLTDNMVSNMKNLEDLATSISSDLKSATDNFENAASRAYEDLESHSSNLEAINTRINEKTDELVKYIDSLMENKTVEEMLSIISSGDWPIDTKDAMYMRIIAQEPTNETVFSEYINFLNEIEAEQVYYYDLHSLLTSVLYSLDIEEIPVLLEEINLVNSILENKVLNENQLLTESWNSLYSSFEDQAENFDDEMFVEICNSLADYYNLLSTTTTEIDLQFEYSQYVYSFYNSFAEYMSYAEKLLESEYETISTLYVSANNIWITIMTQFLSRDIDDDGIFSNVLENMLDEIESKGESVNLYFEELLGKEIANELTSVERKIMYDDLSLSSYEMPGDIQTKIATLSNIATTDESYDILERYANYVGKYQRALYVSYQEWAANILSKSDGAIDEAKTENDLKALFDAGYFNIDSSLLIPQLKTWYDGLCTNSMIEKSSIPLESLVGEIHIMGLDDMENIQ